MTHQSDIELARLIRASDHHAFQIVYNRYCEPLYHYLWSRLGESESARELLQEIFVRLWQSRERLRPTRSLKPYIYRMANNLIIDYYRRQKVRIQYKELEKNRTSEGSNENPELKTLIKLALQTLPDKLRTVFILHHVKKYTYDEIAEMCQVSKKTVENRMKKAIVHLRKKLNAS